MAQRKAYYMGRREALATPPRRMSNNLDEIYGGAHLLVASCWHDLAARMPAHQRVLVAGQPRRGRRQ